MCHVKQSCDNSCSSTKLFEHMTTEKPTKMHESYSTLLLLIISLVALPLHCEAFTSSRICSIIDKKHATLHFSVQRDLRVRPSSFRVEHDINSVGLKPSSITARFSAGSNNDSAEIAQTEVDEIPKDAISNNECENTVSSSTQAAKENSSETVTAGKVITIPPTNEIKGVIFDMDGTLIKQSIDFASLRQRTYAIADRDANLRHLPLEERRGDVLELFHDLSPDGQVLAKKLFDEIEEKALVDMAFMEDVGDLCAFLDEMGIPRGVLTRNVEKSVNVMHEKLWDEHGVKEFYPAVNRETKGKDGKGTLPSKPNPDAILYICDLWGLDPKNVIMVGDSAADDMAAASRAGCGGRVLLAYKGESLDNDAGGGDAKNEAERKERKPSLIVKSLGELLDILKA